MGSGCGADGLKAVGTGKSGGRFLGMLETTA